VVLHGSHCCYRLCSVVTRSLHGVDKNIEGTRACCVSASTHFSSVKLHRGFCCYRHIQNHQRNKQHHVTAKTTIRDMKVLLFFGYKMTYFLTARRFFSSYEISCMEQMEEEAVMVPLRVHSDQSLGITEEDHGHPEPRPLF
jgi:hypothetical protein